MVFGHVGGQFDRAFLLIVPDQVCPFEGAGFLYAESGFDHEGQGEPVWVGLQAQGREEVREFGGRDVADRGHFEGAPVLWARDA